MIQSAARRQISGFALPAMLATLIYSLIVGISGYLIVAQLLIIGPMMVGYVLFCMKIMDQRVGDYNMLFAGFKNFAQTMVAGLLYMLILVVGTILLIVPGIIAACGLSMTFVIMAENYNVSGVDALKMSWNMMMGHKWEYFCLCFRFIGWLLLNILTLGILGLWIQPWMQMSTINFYRDLKYGRY